MVTKMSDCSWTWFPLNVENSPSVFTCLVMASIIRLFSGECSRQQWSHLNRGSVLERSALVCSGAPVCVVIQLRFIYLCQLLTVSSSLILLSRSARRENVSHGPVPRARLWAERMEPGLLEWRGAGAGCWPRQALCQRPPEALECLQGPAPSPTGQAEVESFLLLKSSFRSSLQWCSSLKP